MRDTNKPYHNIDDVEKIYIILNGSSKNFTAFAEEAKRVGSSLRSSNGAYLFNKEDKLFNLFAAVFPEELKVRKITQFGELVQLLEWNQDNIY